MTALTTTAPRTPGFVLGPFAACVAAVAVWASGTVAAAPAAVGLSSFAWSDGRARRYSLRTMLLTVALTVACLVVELARALDWRRGIAMLLAVAFIGCGALLMWIAVSGIAFGDVLLLTYTAVVPAWVSPASAMVTIVATFLVAGAVVIIRRLACRDALPGASVALAPPLLAGWLIGLMSA